MSKKLMSKRTLLSQRGQALSEYLILTLMVAVASIVAVRSVGHTVYEKLHQIQTSLQGVTIESVQGSNNSSTPLNLTQ